MKKPAHERSLNRDFLKIFEHNEQPLFQALARVRQKLDDCPHFGVDTAEGTARSYPFATPLLVEAAAQKRLSTVVQTVRTALQDVGERLRRGEDLLPGRSFYTATITPERFGFDHGYAEIAPIIRLDLSPTAHGPMTLEINTGCPGGEADGGILAQTFFSDPLLSESIARIGQTTFVDPRRESLEKILRVYQEFRARVRPELPSRPAIGIVTSEAQQEALRPEALATAEYYRAQGYETVTGDLSALMMREGRPRLDSSEIHLLYRKFSTISFFKRLNDPTDYPHLAEVHEAYRERRYCMVNPLSSTLLQDKGLLYVLRRDYPETHSMIPETWLLDSDLPCDAALWERVRSGEEFIVKRRISFAGKWVILDPEEIRARIPELLSNEPGRWIVQKRIEPARDTFAVVRGETIDVGTRAYNVAAFGASFFVRVSLGGPFNPINAGTGGAEAFLLAV